jgi:hypothetical protein
MKLNTKKVVGKLNPHLSEGIPMIKKLGSVQLTDKKATADLSIAGDFDLNPHNPKDWNAVFLFSPNKDSFEHYHVEISNKKALELRDWLDKYLMSQNMREKSWAKRSSKK